jgi:hypothetical protein
MAFKRKDIRAILEDESLSVEERTARLVGLHMETVDALNDKIVSLQSDADKLKDAQTKLSDLEAKQGGDATHEKDSRRIIKVGYLKCNCHKVERWVRFPYAAGKSRTLCAVLFL